jgi:transposase
MVRVDRSPVHNGDEALPVAVQGGRGGVVPVTAGRDDRAIADDLGVNRETLRSWVRRDDEQRGVADVPRPVMATATGSVEAENAALRRRVRELEEERDILRKAARYFAGETRW